MRGAGKTQHDVGLTIPRGTGPVECRRLRGAGGVRGSAALYTGVPLGYQSRPDDPERRACVDFMEWEPVAA
jgi:hypothetical protein